ncbi:MAG: response regulator [Candidatus Natronoplasma sp.]
MVKILVADDEARMRKLIKHLLSEYDIAGEAADGEETLEKLDELKPDIITLDIQMPKKDGLEVLSEIEGEEDVKIIVVSVVAPEELDGDKLKKEVDAYLVKPFKQEELLQAVKDVLGEL